MSDLSEMYQEALDRFGDILEKVSKSKGCKDNFTWDYKKKKCLPCPGSRIRSKGRGRGMGVGKGKGPIGFYGDK